MSDELDGPGQFTVGDPGVPEVDVEALADDTDLGEALSDDEPAEVTEVQVRAVLAAGGRGLGYVAGHPDVPNHWHFTDDELDELTPPVTRYVNRSALLRRAVGRSDFLTIVMAMGIYTSRNIEDLRDAKEAAGEDQREAGSGLDGVVAAAQDAARR